MNLRYVTLVSSACKRAGGFVRNVFKKKSCGASPVNGEIQKNTICEVKYSEGFMKAWNSVSFQS